MAATLANGGRHPRSGQAVVARQVHQRTIGWFPIHKVYGPWHSPLTRLPSPLRLLDPQVSVFLV
jgi:hypothetical protein